MITQSKMQQAVDDINNKICPSEMEEAVVYLFTQLTKLQHENSNLKQELKEVYWRLEEQD